MVGPKGPIEGEVTRYDYAFDLATAQFSAELTVDVAPPGGDCFAVACRRQPLTAVYWNGAPVESQAFIDDMLSLCDVGVGPGPLAVGAEGVVPEQTYLSGLDIGFSRRTNKAGGEFSYLLSWVGGCDHFGPCDSHPARLAEFHFEVAHPEGTVVLCPGALTPGETMTRCDLAGTLAPTYSAFALAADPLWQRAPFTSAAGVDLVFYEVPNGGIAAALDPASVGDFMTWITGLLGPYPYGSELRVAGAPTAWLGFEHPANIVLYEDLGEAQTDYADTAMHVLMHEIIHQWAGDRTTLASAEDFVWKEATAEYLAYVFEDEQRPPGEAAATRAYWDDISDFATHYPRPLDDPPPAVQDFYGDVYGPGPMVLYVQLEAMLGRAAVLDGIKAFLAEPGARSVEDLKLALEQASSEDLDAYFDVWVFGAGVPERPSFAIELQQEGDQVTVNVTQMNASGRLFGCAVEVEVTGAMQSARAIVDFGLAPTSETASATVTLQEQATGYVLDPDHRLIARDISGGKQPAPDVGPRRVWVF